MTSSQNQKPEVDNNPTKSDHPEHNTTAVGDEHKNDSTYEPHDVLDVESFVSDQDQNDSSLANSTTSSDLSPNEAPAMPKPKVIFHFIRHGQAEHNLKSLSNEEAVAIHDPALTTHGQRQCEHLRDSFPSHSTIDLILSSPLQRTQQTTLTSFPSYIQSKKKVFLWHDLKELGDAPCNTGAPKIKLLQELDCDIWDCSLLKDDWEVRSWKVSRISTRVARLRRTLRMLAKVMIEGGVWKHLSFWKWTKDRDVEVVVVSHGTLLQFLCQHEHAKFYNGDWKTMIFPDAEFIKTRGKSGLTEDDLVETSESLERGSCYLIEKKRAKKQNGMTIESKGVGESKETTECTSNAGI